MFIAVRRAGEKRFAGPVLVCVRLAQGGGDRLLDR
jgi:hypothetical protein